MSQNVTALGLLVRGYQDSEEYEAKSISVQAAGRWRMYEYRGPDLLLLP